jgi:hypothetical protein
LKLAKTEEDLKLSQKRVVEIETDLRKENSFLREGNQALETMNLILKSQAEWFSNSFIAFRIPELPNFGSRFNSFVSSASSVIRPVLSWTWFLINIPFSLLSLIPKQIIGTVTALGLFFLAFVIRDEPEIPSLAYKELMWRIENMFRSKETFERQKRDFQARIDAFTYIAQQNYYDTWPGGLANALAKMNGQQTILLMTSPPSLLMDQPLKNLTSPIRSMPSPPSRPSKNSTLTGRTITGSGLSENIYMWQRASSRVGLARLQFFFVERCWCVPLVTRTNQLQWQESRTCCGTEKE